MAEGNANSGPSAKAAGNTPPIYANLNVPKEAGQGGNNVKISATRAGGDMKWKGGNNPHGKVKSKY